MELIPLPWRFGSKLKFDYMDQIASFITERKLQKIYVCGLEGDSMGEVTDKLVSALRSRGIRVSVQNVDSPLPLGVLLSSKTLHGSAKSAEEAVKLNMLQLISMSIDGYLANNWSDLRSIRGGVSEALFRAKLLLARNTAPWIMGEDEEKRQEEFRKLLRSLDDASGVLIDPELMFQLSPV
ncbi:MAG TPA: hypothetical protein VKU79_06265 [Thermoplasmataceae archaeon]|nr:hypothetical protein [Thermoplasmatales archaeon AK]HLH86447.1 hypothetical protein [Thermoplasmataceae archaeon]